MARDKDTKPLKVPNKHLHARVSYLYQAATYLTSHQQPQGHLYDATVPGDGPERRLSSALAATGTSTLSTLETALPDEHETEQGSTSSAPAFLKTATATPGLSLHIASHLRAISSKAQVRLSRDIKRSLCKRCNTLLIPGQTSMSRLENRSRGGRKPWADVLVVLCSSCGAEKRFPVGSKQQTRKPERAADASNLAKTAHSGVERSCHQDAPAAEAVSSLGFVVSSSE